jgi:hypothetical protein
VNAGSGPASTPAAPLPSTLSARRAAIAGGVGTLIEYYDFSVYAFLAVTLGPLFFPSSQPNTTNGPRGPGGPAVCTARRRQATNRVSVATSSVALGAEERARDSVGTAQQQRARPGSQECWTPPWTVLDRVADWVALEMTYTDSVM